jgi:16S rRNA (cytosine967-C5)-methyltransferase
MNDPLILQHSEEFLTSYDLSEPLHIVLADYFQRKRHLGVKDRRVIADYIYAAVRHYRRIIFLLGLEENERLFYQDHLTAMRALLMVHRLLNGEDAQLTFQHRDLMSEMWPELQAIEIKTAEKPDIEYSLPEWIWKKLCAQWGEETAKKVGESLLKPAEIHLRRQSRYAISDNWEQKYGIKRGNLIPESWRASKSAPIRLWDIFKKGEIEIQDEGSQLIGLAAQSKTAKIIIDLCAGAGGKTMQLAATSEAEQEIIATDKLIIRTSGLKIRLKRCRIKNVQIQRYTEVLNQYRGRADTVLADVPCTGTGVFRRNPDDKFRLDPEQLENFLRAQRFVLRDAARLLKPGGELIYASCSLLQEENENQIEKFLKRYPYFVLLDEQERFAEFGIRLEKTGEGPGFTLLPHLFDTDGFYVAVLKRVR